MPVVVLLGPRQLGKTTLAIDLTKLELGKSFHYLDLELGLRMREDSGECDPVYDLNNLWAIYSLKNNCEEWPKILADHK